ncbi:efflux RND transporter periplasmic adaptor subunit [Corallincola holothuriorum]|uniref:Efflux RND transporter periplasmic adaptor subunit n=1 Tax=Corallincola holothuriorum TaxID=2282215 RepID=A0A368NP00_9GAMM|nr:efflux RND transporter periplasmic adaptor subunit [Corallincola holothuriorum]RCU51031.1 efflux RND transporter periplasmic adaptor subunit [Corallincola holothuriorum]
MNIKLTTFLIAGLLSSAALSASETKYEHTNESPPTESHEKHQAPHLPGENDNEEHDHEAHDEHIHEKDDKHEHETELEADIVDEDHGTEGAAILSQEQLALANIVVEPLKARQIDYQLYAPGEVLTNGYTSYRVSPRVPSLVLSRHVALGEHVKKGQALVTLFSESVAASQSQFRTAWPEWQRVKSLGKKTVGAQRYIEAKSNLEAVQATLLAYGLSGSDLESLKAQNTPSLGEYTLRAEIDGSVLADKFEQGQRIEAGEPLILIADEKQLWVEAHLPPNLALSLDAGAKAEVVSAGIRLEATVSQEGHTIDPVTRTRLVRLLVENVSHQLHPGQFAEVFFSFRSPNSVIAVPESALMRDTHGDWTVFVEDHPGKFLPQEVELGESYGQVREIIGIKPGTRVVTKGAFFVASQIAKGGFDPHNH